MSKPKKKRLSRAFIKKLRSLPAGDQREVHKFMGYLRDPAIHSQDKYERHYSEQDKPVADDELSKCNKCNKSSL